MTFGKISDENIKPKYSSIYSIWTSIINGARKIANYSVLKKILLVRFLRIKLIHTICSK